MKAYKATKTINKDKTRLYTVYKSGGFIPVFSVMLNHNLTFKQLQNEFNRHNKDKGLIMSMVTKSI